MEFELSKEKEIRTKSDGLEVHYVYYFKGTDESNKTKMSVTTEKDLHLNKGATINIEFKDIQTKVR